MLEFFLCLFFPTMFIIQFLLKKNAQFLKCLFLLSLFPVQSRRDCSALATLDSKRDSITESVRKTSIPAQVPCLTQPETGTDQSGQASEACAPEARSFGSADTVLVQTPVPCGGSGFPDTLCPRGCRCSTIRSRPIVSAGQVC